MSSLTIRKLDPTIKARLRVRAAGQGRSMEDEARRILGEALSAEAAKGSVEPANAYDRLRRHFAHLGGVELELPPRSAAREPPAFE